MSFTIFLLGTCCRISLCLEGKVPCGRRDAQAETQLRVRGRAVRRDLIME